MQAAGVVGFGRCRRVCRIGGGGASWLRLRASTGGRRRTSRRWTEGSLMIQAHTFLLYGHQERKLQTFWSSVLIVMLVQLYLNKPNFLTGETAQSIEPPKTCCNLQDPDQLCERSTCFACNSIREAESHEVRGTLLIPCRTAMRGSFPLNGTYFQVNEVFADHYSSYNPIYVPRGWIWNLPRRTVYFGTSIPTIFRGLTTEMIQQCFWRGFVCVRGFDRVTRAPKPLYARLHFPASKAPKNRKAAESKVEK